MPHRRPTGDAAVCATRQRHSRMDRNRQIQIAGTNLAWGVPPSMSSSPSRKPGMPAPVRLKLVNTRSYTRHRPSAHSSTRQFQRGPSMGPLRTSCTAGDRNGKRWSRRPRLKAANGVKYTAPASTPLAAKTRTQRATRAAMLCATTTSPSSAPTCASVVGCTAYAAARQRAEVKRRFGCARAPSPHRAMLTTQHASSRFSSTLRRFIVRRKRTESYVGPAAKLCESFPSLAPSSTASSPLSPFGAVRTLSSVASMQSPSAANCARTRATVLSTGREGDVRAAALTTLEADGPGCDSASSAGSMLCGGGGRSLATRRPPARCSRRARASKLSGRSSGRSKRAADTYRAAGRSGVDMLRLRKAPRVDSHSDLAARPRRWYRSAPDVPPANMYVWNAEPPTQSLPCRHRCRIVTTFLRGRPPLAAPRQSAAACGRRHPAFAPGSTGVRRALRSQRAAPRPPPAPPAPPAVRRPLAAAATARGGR
eukprot:scaffold916_cov516-Prasinococcus_capsulatus_cf.AAC.24